MAFIQKSTVPISFTGGLASKSDALQVQAPALLQLENAQFDKVGALNKRPGYNILSTSTLDGGTITSAAAIDAYNGELVLFDGLTVYSYVEANGTWANRGPAISLINSSQQIIRRGADQQINPDCASLDGIEVYVWEDSRGTCRYSVLDAATGAYAVSDQVLAGSLTGPKVVVFAGLFYLFATSNNNLAFSTINPTNPGVISLATTILADGAPAVNPNASGAPFSSLPYDVTVSNGRLYVAYFATGALKLFYLTSGNVVTGLQTVGAGTTGIAVTVVGDSALHVWVAFASGLPAVAVACYDGTTPTPTLLLAPTLVDAVTCPDLAGIESVNPGSLELAYEVLGGIPSVQLTKAVIIQPTGALSPVGQLRSVGLASKPFRQGSNIFVNLAYQSTLQSTYFTVLLTSAPFTIVGKAEPQVGGGLRTNGLMGEANEITPGVFLWANLTKGAFISEDNTSFSLLGVSASTIDFTDVNKFNAVTFSNNLLVVGGILQSYDGVSMVEQNFHIFPEEFSAMPVGSGGALSAGQYQYVVVYAWTDRFGQIQLSTPSPPVTVTTVANDSVGLAILTLRLSAKTGITIRIYRTQVNGVVFQETTSELAPLLNDPTVDLVTFTDLNADVDIAANQVLYTTGGVLPNAAPPSCSMVSLYQDRVILGGLEDRNLLWYSKNQGNVTSFNTIPAEFSASLTIGVSQVGGPITALGLMDANLIIFKRGAIFILTGDGPNDAGGGSSFSDPQLVSSTVGCDNPNSIVLTGAGLMFQSPTKGIWMLGRGLGEPQYIGAGVDTEAREFVVSSATLDPSSNSAIFTTSNGPALVYDYLISQWSTWTNHQSVDAVPFGGLFSFVRANGQVYQQAPGTFADGVLQGVPVPYSLRLTTPWLSYASTLGYQSVFRAFILGQYRGPHVLTVDVGYDFSAGFFASTAIPASSLPVAVVWGSDPLWGASTPWGGAWAPYTWQINFNRQKCTSFRLRISDASAGIEGYTISALLLEVGQLPGGVRLPLARKFAAQ